MNTITIDFELTPCDFTDIVDTACMVIGYWAQHVEFEEPYDEQDPPSTMTVVCEEGETHKILATDLEKAMVAASEGKIKISQSIRGDIILAIKENDMGHIDGDAADVLVQIACFGEIVYG